MEYAVNKLNIENASHEAINQSASDHIINKLSCSLVGLSLAVHVMPKTLAYESYGKGLIVERFQCNYGLNENYKNEVNDGNLKITGFDDDGNARIIEISNHRFFIATLFLPQLTSGPGMPHPLIISFVNAAIKFRDMKR